MLANMLAFAKRFARDEHGSFVLEFAITFPMLIMLSFGLLEFSLVVFDYQRASEATRRGVRLAIIQEPIPNTANLLEGAVIICIAADGVTVTCTGGSPSDEADARFAELLLVMRQIYPTLTGQNIIITFEATDVGSADDIGGIFPLVTLELSGVVHEMIVGHLIGISQVEFPSFRTTVLGNGKWVNTAGIDIGYTGAAA